MQFCFITVFFFACKKGEDLPGKAYGRITATSTFTADAGPLLVLVDGIVKDTLSFEKQSLTKPIISEVGEKKYSLIKLSDRSVLYENTLNIQTGKTTSAAPFLYDGLIALFDDLTAKPEKDSLLIRFVNLVPTLPDLVDLKINLTDDDTGIKYYIKTVKGVGKKDFSTFVQLPNPIKITSGASRYSVDIYDAVTGENKGTDRFFNFTTQSGTASFIANVVSSFALKPGSRGRISVESVFQRKVE